MNTSDLEHDSAQESGKRLKFPASDKAVKTPPNAKDEAREDRIERRRQKRRDMQGEREEPWLHVDNPAIWTRI